MSQRVMVYSHDTFGLGNIRRMLAVSEHLLKAIPGVSVLLVTGSPVVHEFRLRQGLDYIKLPCLSRAGRDEYSAKTLGTDIGQLMRMRSALILSAARNFRPDVVLVDKKPDGVKHELRPTLEHLSRQRPDCRISLVLRDILDAPDVTEAAWRAQGFGEVLERYFHSILILGDPAVFDAAREYKFSGSVRKMVRYCGYARRNTPVQNEVDVLRHRLLAGYGKLVLVTPGGGEDGWNLVSSYTDAAPRIGGVRSVIVCGPEMPAHLREQICIRTADDPSISVTEFSGEMLHYMAAADVIVSMAGYNTICEIVSLGKRAVVVPRVHPVQEQFIRAERLAALGTLRMIHPDALTAAALAEMVQRELRETAPVRFPASLDGLEAIADWVQLSAPQPAILGKETLWRASATF